MTTKIVVFQDKYIEGVDSLETPPSTFGELLPLREALEREWASDAHMVMYSIPKLDTPFRINKPALPSLHERRIFPETSAFCLDWDYTDLSGKKVSGGMTDEVFSKCLTALQGFLTLYPPFAVYSTKNGFRLMYRLSKPLPVDWVEKKYLWFVTEASKPLQNAGLDGFDDACKDWTRLFRMPRVLRDGERFHGHLVIDELATLNVHALKELEVSRSRGSAVEVPADMPTSEQVRQLKYGDAGDDSAVWMTILRKRLGNARGDSASVCRQLHDWIYMNMEQPVEQVGRNTDLGKWCGVVANKMLNYDGFTHEHLFAFFYDKVWTWEEEETRHDRPEMYWMEVLWRASVRMWDMVQESEREREREKEARKKQREENKAKREEEAREREERRAEREEKKKQLEHRKEQWNEQLEQKAEEFTDLRESIVAGMKESDITPVLHHASLDQAWEYAKSRLIIRIGPNKFHLIRQDGKYSPTIIDKDSLISEIRNHSDGMEGVINTYTLTNEGGTASRKVSEILEEHCATVSRTELGCGSSRAILSADKTLTYSGYWIDETLRPQEDAQVDEWLRLFAGKYYNKLIKWIAWCLDITNRSDICALSFSGENGTGKTLLINGISECFGPGHLAVSGKEIFQSNTEFLGYHPIIAIDEKISVQDSRTDVASEIRQLLGGTAGMLQSNRKGVPRIPIKAKPRIIMAGNGDDLLRRILKTTQGPADLAATARRIMHMDMEGEMEAREYLEAVDTTSWCGEGTDRRIARHCLWLYSQLAAKSVPGGEWERDPRFLVEGNPEALSDLAYEASEKGDARLWSFQICKLIDLARSQKHHKEIEGMVLKRGEHYIIDDDGFVCLKVAVLTQLLSRAFPSESFTNQRVGRVFSHFITTKRYGNTRWKRINEPVLHKYADYTSEIEETVEDGVLCKVG